jgi:hypothetical protein
MPPDPQLDWHCSGQKARAKNSRPDTNVGSRREEKATITIGLAMYLAKGIVLLLCIALSCAAQTQTPDTPAGHRCAGWLDAYNIGDSRIYHAFLKKHFPSRLQTLDSTMTIRRSTGGFDLKKVEESSNTKLTVLVQERDSDQMVRLSFTVEAAEPHRITGLQWDAVPRPAEFARAGHLDTHRLWFHSAGPGC